MNKKGQEEIIGFVIIIVLVLVILLFFLGYFLRQEKEEIESHRVNTFLISLMQTTTDCRYNDYSGFETVREIVEDCLDNRGGIRKCEDGREACEVMNDAIEGSLEGGWDVNEKGNIKGYDLRISYMEREEERYHFGNLSGHYKGGSYKLNSETLVTLDIFGSDF